MASEKIKLTVHFEAVSAEALAAAIAAFASEFQELAPGDESSLSTAGWRRTSKLEVERDDVDEETEGA